jgi:acyl carrier protein
MGLKEDVKIAIAEILDVDATQLGDTAKLYDSIGVDSTEMVELTVSLGKRFNVKLASTDISKFSTPLEIVSVIEKRK